MIFNPIKYYHLLKCNHQLKCQLEYYHLLSLAILIFFLRSCDVSFLFLAFEFCSIFLLTFLFLSLLSTSLLLNHFLVDGQLVEYYFECYFFSLFDYVFHLWKEFANKRHLNTSPLLWL